MSIDKDLEAYDELCDELAYVGSRKFDQGLVADAIVALIDAKLDARLSPAPVGGEKEEEERFKALVDAYRKDPTGSWAPTPPPAEPDGGEANYADMTSPQLLAAIADLEQRLAGAKAGWDMALATIAERDRRIAALEAGLKECIEDYEDAANYKDEYLRNKHGDADQITKYRALISPATDKGGE